MPNAAPRLSTLVDAAIITVAGADARAFLHAQLSRSITDLAPDEAPLAAWHDARGRVRAVFHVVPAADRWLLLTSAELAAALVAKLRLFVLRADVALAIDDALVARALVGDARGWLAAAGLGLAAKPNALLRAGDVSWLRIGPELIYAVAPAASIRAAARTLETAPPEAAELAAIRCGIPRIGAALAERYIPQMLNLDQLGAVSLDKGCYPGQEVITRTHHLGTVKRRMGRFAAASANVPSPATAVVDAAGQPAGEIIRAAPAESGIELLAVVRVDAGAAPRFVAGETAPLTELPLPY